MIVQDDDALDLHCLQATALRDRALFEQLYRRHHPRLGRFLRRYTPRPDLIDDVINETMWVVWRKADEFRGDSKVSTWITGIACRCMLKALRGLGPAHDTSEPSAEHPQPELPEHVHGE
ncbi:MAG: RNA polymerase subunit sigma-70, partial [Rubrivivax sp.]